MENFVSDRTLLEKVAIKKPTYAIGIDTYDKESLAYCLTRKVDGVIEILLLKTMKDEAAFEEEVNNLAKYFDAIKLRG